MSKNGNNDPRPLGVPLDDLSHALELTTLTVAREDNALVVGHEHFSTRVDVLPPDSPDPVSCPIMAVVRVRTELPGEIAALFGKPGTAAQLNGMATLGALTLEDRRAYVGSRLTMYHADDAWSIQFPLLLFSIIGGTDSLLGPMRRAFTGSPGEKSESSWQGSDFEQVERHLSRLSLCNAGADGLTAEFGLQHNVVSALAGDHQTALWQLRADQPHPELGGGLFCLLELPHQIRDEARLDHVIVQLNQLEMAPDDLPPHFGAWCRGGLGNNPAYVSFLPNALHAAPGIAVNVSIWAYHRALWANAMLASLGFRE